MIKKLLYLVLLLALVVPALLPQVAMAQSIINSNIGAASGFGYTQHKKTFYAEGRHWVFYFTNPYIKYQTSLDGETWAAGINVTTNASTVEQFALAYDGTYIDYICREDLSHLYYRRGTPNADGTITWLAAEQDIASSNFNRQQDIAIDTNHNAWVIYCRDPGSGTYPYVVKNANIDGTWSGVETTQLSSASASWGVSIAPLSSGKLAAMYVIQSVAGDNIRVKRYTGAAWGSEAKTTSQTDNQGFQSWSWTVQDDDVHITFIKEVTFDLVYTTYSYSTNSFSAETTLYSGATSTSAPVITRDTTNNDLWVWYENDPTDDHLYMAKYVSSEATWYTEYDLLDEVDDLPANGYYLNSHYTAPRDNIGLFYIAGTAILKFKSISEQFDVDTLEPSGVTETQATLRGEIISIGWGTPHERGFYWDTTPSLGNTTGTLQLWYETGSFSTGVFTHTASDLAEGQSYYYIAYATNAETVYGEWVETTAGGTEGWCVVTLEPDPVGDFEATFRGNITEVAGTYAEIHGFQWGHTATATATWEWTDTGQFTVGIYTYEAELEADSIYYVRAFAGNSTTVDYGQWIGFITDQPSYIDDPTEGSNILPAAPDEPGGWIKPPRDWGTALGIPWTFILYVVLSSLVVIIGIGLSAVQARTISVLFIVFGFILGWFCFWPRGGYLDWWIMLPYILVGWALMNREKESPLA